MFFAFPRLVVIIIIQCIKGVIMTETISVGPVRIPKSYKVGLDQLKAGKDHITISCLIREAIFLLLVKRGVIEIEEEYGND